MKPSEIVPGKKYRNKQHPGALYMGVRPAWGNGPKNLVIIDTDMSDMLGSLCAKGKGTKYFWAAFYPAN
jgi:hypothetical protein